MALYSKPLTQIIEEEALNQLPEPFSSEQIITWVREKYPLFKDSTIRAYLRAMSVNDPNRKHYTVRRDVLFKLGRSIYRKYDAERDGLYDAEGKPLDGPIPEEEADLAEAASEEEIQFALELHLEDFMQANWARIDFGRRLSPYQGANGRSGRQFPTDIGVIDFLCQDIESGDFVVIELKKGRSSDQVLGQCQRYMGWVQETLATPGQSVRGLIIAPEQDERLRYALKVAPNVQMLCYRVSFQLVQPQEKKLG